MVGEFRKGPVHVVSGAVHNHRIHFEAPPAKSLKTEMENFLDWFNHQSRDINPLLRAGIAHLWFITIHPFEDRNGRIARAITDLALAQAENHAIRFYALSAAMMKNRKSYYEILESSQKNHLDITPWLNWFLEILEIALQNAIQQIQWTILKAKFWYTHNKNGLKSRQIKVLNKMIDAKPNHFTVNARRYMSLTKVSKATATRDLTELSELGCIKKIESGGRSTGYIINLD